MLVEVFVLIISVPLMIFLLGSLVFDWLNGIFNFKKDDKEQKDFWKNL